MNAFTRLLFIGLLGITPITSCMNLSRPHDIFFRPSKPPKDLWLQFYSWIEGGLKQTAYTSDGHSTNVLTYINCDQDALKMLNGFIDDSVIEQTAAQLNGVVDNGIRGHYIVSGHLKVPVNVSLAWRMFFAHDLTLGIYLPIRSMQLTDVCWANQTQNNDYQDALVHNVLTNNFFENVYKLGDGLELGGWSKAGVGDLEVILEYMHDFEQAKPMLKNVFLDARVGLTFPTGVTSNPDHILSLPFGQDGAMSVLFGGYLELLYGTFFKLAVDVELTHVFNNTRTRRVKTAVEQTELLLLAKADVNKDWGIQQQFTLWASFDHFFKGFSFNVGYRYFKQGDSTVSLCNNDLSPFFANSALGLEDWTAHDVLFKLSYDWRHDYNNCNPGLALTARVPVNGKRSIVSHTLGFMAWIDF